MKLILRLRPPEPGAGEAGSIETQSSPEIHVTRAERAAIPAAFLCIIILCGPQSIRTMFLVTDLSRPKPGAQSALPVAHKTHISGDLAVKKQGRPIAAVDGGSGDSDSADLTSYFDTSHNATLRPHRPPNRPEIWLS